MKLVNKLGKLVSHGRQEPYLIVLHDTAGPTLGGAESTLKQRGLGYHYMIDNNGDCHEYAKPTSLMWHAKDYNLGTVGVSFVGGGDAPPVSEVQIKALIELVNTRIKPLGPDIIQITCHKHASHAGKVDPRWPGEPSNGISLGIDRIYMGRIAKAVGLEFLGHGEV
jgi:N-acetyl-anhydromuramyl-L-alanine amidase AmpD